jgi:hypothetical protein
MERGLIKVDIAFDPSPTIEARRLESLVLGPSKEPSPLGYMVQWVCRPFNPGKSQGSQWGPSVHMDSFHLPPHANAFTINAPFMSEVTVGIAGVDDAYNVSPPTLFTFQVSDQALPLPVSNIRTIGASRLEPDTNKSKAKPVQLTVNGSAVDPVTAEAQIEADAMVVITKAPDDPECPHDFLGVAAPAMWLNNIKTLSVRYPTFSIHLAKSLVDQYDGSVILGNGQAYSIREFFDLDLTSAGEQKPFAVQCVSAAEATQE